VLAGETFAAARLMLVVRVAAADLQTHASVRHRSVDAAATAALDAPVAACNRPRQVAAETVARVDVVARLPAAVNRFRRRHASAALGVPALARMPAAAARQTLHLPHVSALVHAPVLHLALVPAAVDPADALRFANAPGRQSGRSAAVLVAGHANVAHPAAVTLKVMLRNVAALVATRSNAPAHLENVDALLALAARMSLIASLLGRRRISRMTIMKHLLPYKKPLRTTHPRVSRNLFPTRKIRKCTYSVTLLC